MFSIKEFFKNLLGVVRAIIRLFLVTITFFLSGLNNVLFSGREVCGFSFNFDILSQDVEKISYLQKLDLQLEEGMEEEDGDDFLYIDEDDEGYEE